MKGDVGAVEFLNKALRHELTAVNQYWLHYRLLDNRGTSDLDDYGKMPQCWARCKRGRTRENRFPE
jgi:bacterioferritin (cytochrome b1)